MLGRAFPSRLGALQESCEGHTGPAAAAGHHVHALLRQPGRGRDLPDRLHLFQLLPGVLPGAFVLIYAEPTCQLSSLTCSLLFLAGVLRLGVLLLPEQRGKHSLLPPTQFALLLL